MWINDYDCDNVWNEVACMNKYYEQIDFYIGTVTTLHEGKSILHIRLNIKLGDIKQSSEPWEGIYQIRLFTSREPLLYSSKLALCVATR
jgi:hypothetical protein